MILSWGLPREWVILCKASTKTANIKQRFWSKETWETWDPFCRQNIDPEDLISAVMFFAICSITVIWKSWVLRPLVTCQYIIKRPLGEIESQRACYFNTNLSVVNFFLHGSLLKQRHYHYQWRELTSLRGRFRRGRVRGDSSSPPLFGACHAGWGGQRRAIFTHPATNGYP